VLGVPRQPPSSPDAVQRGDARSTASDRLIEQKDRILSLWEARLRKEVGHAGRAPQPILINTIPAVLDQLAEALSPEHPRVTATQGSTVAQEHGGERVRLTHFGLDDMVAEYKILRQVLFEVLEEHEPLQREERNTLNMSLDQAIMEACTGYVLVQASFRDQFFATMAHDLRNPLNVAQAGCALILRHSKDAEVTRWARRIVDNISRVDRRLQDLLNAMRVRAGGRLQLDLQSCDVAALVRQIIEGLRAEHGDRFALDAPDSMDGHVAPDAVRRAVENLADNAVKYGAPSGTITVTLSETHGRAILKVHNDGPHIPPEDQETLFRAFQRLRPAEQSDKAGWGLGLAQVRSVAEAHGGSIGVDSLPDRGTTFIVDIPLDARPYQANPTNSTA
jgi:signal transduction histidine kinase